MAKVKKEVVLEESTEDEKRMYDEYLQKNKVDIERRIESDMGSIKAHTDEQLKNLAKNYLNAPFDRFPETANFVKLELERRGFIEEAKEYGELIKKIPWHSKSWMNF